ncbi:MAG: cytidine deaminase [Rubrobacter sp.]|jgi:cytidine deaminase|nr:cytidine deaminase [Rubrobacter sp.]MBA3950462.1 cytidine deaminase [Rubrobacter sp.]MDQ3361594.1 cytidine deaminase [Actinomycetota bacterium]
MKDRSPDVDSLMNAAREAAQTAYAPYSRFLVGAAILTEGGTVHAGCNVENASYGLSICAERNAATSMVSADPDDRRIKSVAVFSPNTSPCFPCGACRQFLREFGCEEVVVEDALGLCRYPFEEILPNSFGPEDL